MTAYPFRQGIDYGQRSGTLGLSYHMSEGTDTLVDYLAQRQGETAAAWRQRVSGVSCHAALLSDGTLWQMLGWERICGNLNPDDRAGEYGYYGGSHLKAVLGDGWTDPNRWTLSMEIAGRRADGPTDAQATTAIAWGLEMRDLFSTLRGANGHHDQSPKACPGLTPNMRAIFDGIGGHGLWTTQEDPMGLAFRITERITGTVNVTGAGHALIRVDNAQLVGIPAGHVREVVARIVTLVAVPGHEQSIPAGSTGYLVGNIPGALPDRSVAAMLLARDGVFTPTPNPVQDCSATIATAIAADRKLARVVWS